MAYSSELARFVPAPLSPLLPVYRPGGGRGAPALPHEDQDELAPVGIAATFGGESRLARGCIQALHGAIRGASDPKVFVPFGQWRLLFGRIGGRDLEAHSPSIAKLAAWHGVADPGAGELLFAVHSYYALFIRLLTAAIAAPTSAAGTSALKRCAAARSSGELRSELERLEQAGSRVGLGPRSSPGGGLFAWYLDAWTSDVAEALRALIRALDSHDFTAASPDPGEGRDLLKPLYHRLLPGAVRHELGEYYTPDWLAELVLDEIGYEGDPDTRLLDPACGSGTFLVAAINRVRRWFRDNRGRCGFGERELCRKILQNVAGFDLSPLAVLAARANYVLALRDLLESAPEIEPPVHLCDSILGARDRAEPHGEVPVPPPIGKVDFVAGNPPWINWESLPEGYRRSTAELWQRYDLFRHRGMKARLGSGKDDVSILMTYVVHDRYLAEGGRLGFVLTQTLFKTMGGGDGFRALSYADGDERSYIRPLRVHDLSDLQCFEGAANRTAVLVADKTRSPFSFPVPYVVWKRRSRGALAEETPLAGVLARTERRELAARPIAAHRPTSPWLTAPAGALPGLVKVIGASDYRARAGCCTWLNGVYWVDVIGEGARGTALIRNRSDVGKIKVEEVETEIEPDLLHPLVRGRDVIRWRAEPSCHIVLPNLTDRLGGIPAAHMKAKLPLTFAYFSRFEAALRRRSGYRRFFGPADPFYSIYNVGPYSLSPWKVLWPEVGCSVRAGVVGPGERGAEKPALADHTLVAVACDGAAEAHYLCALLNSSPARLAALSYVVLHPSPHVLEHLRIPRFNGSALHEELAALSERCHRAAASSGAREPAIREMEREIDALAATLWGIAPAELAVIQDQALIR